MAASDIKKSGWQEKGYVAGGTIVIDDTDTHENLYGLEIEFNETSQIEVCTGYDDQGNEYDFVAEKNWGAALSANRTLFCPDDYYIKTLKLTSGCVLVHEGR